MDIGTAKPDAAEQDSVPHHLIDICTPDQILTLGQYQRLAYKTIDEIQRRNQLPILVGGTGQYVMAVVEGWGIPEVPPQPELRKELEALGNPDLVRWLSDLDPVAAGRIDSRNTRRVIRALEVILVSGRPISELQIKIPPPYDIFIVGLHREREQLYKRIDLRVDSMISQGLVDEVTRLKEQGFGNELPAMSGLGYRQILAYLNGEMGLAEATDRVKFETHRFARQQATWFRRDDKRIHWFELDDSDPWPSIFEAVQTWLSAPEEVPVSE
jgi:tRNA dimethylallyltransferase